MTVYAGRNPQLMMRRITRYIQRDNAEAARRVAERIYKECEALATSPERGRKSSQPGTREIVFTPWPYLAVYRVEQSTVQILRVWHGAQQR